MSKATKILVKKMPIILRKKSIVKNGEFVVPQISKVSRDDVIYRDEEDNLLNGEYPHLTITNTSVNGPFNSIRTKATYTKDSTTIELDSDEVTQVVGNENYDIVLKALCSINDKKLKVQAILALLTTKNKCNTVDISCQTIETDMEIFIRDKSRRKRPTRCKAYVIDDKSTVQTKIKPTSSFVSSQQPPQRSESIETLFDIKSIVDEDSNISDASIGNISLTSCQIPNILENPKSILKNIDKYTKETLNKGCSTLLKLVDGSTVLLQAKPEDFFHIATPQTLRGLSMEDRKRVLLHQAYIDWKYCLQTDEEGNLPIHIAVINNDLELLKRHCALLKSKNSSIDVIGGASMTPLQLSIYKNAASCTSLLLQYGADVLSRDEQARSALHLAADSGVCVDAILSHCKKNARNILQDEEELWKPELETKSDDELAQYLLDNMCAMCNDAGYTPLMLASMQGSPTTVQTLLEASPASVNVQMPTCGNTALYIAFRSAFTEAEASGNRNKIAPNFLTIIETLHKFGADPLITNDSGNSVATLTADFKISDLSQAIANKLLTATNNKKSFENYILVKDKEGEINVESINQRSKKEDKARKVIYFAVDTKKKRGRRAKAKDHTEERQIDSEEKISVKKSPITIKKSSNLITPLTSDIKSIPKLNTNVKIIKNNVIGNKSDALKINAIDNKTISDMTKNPVIVNNPGFIKLNVTDNVKFANFTKMNTNFLNTIKVTSSDIIKSADAAKPCFIKILNPKNNFSNTNIGQNVTKFVINSNIPTTSKNFPAVVKSGGKKLTDNVKIIDNIKLGETTTDNIESEITNVQTQNTLKRPANDIIIKLKKKKS